MLQNEGLLWTFDVVVKFSLTAFKYLGILLDSGLTFTEHARHVRTKVLRTFYSINGQLRQLWRVKADIVWILLETCVLTIFDYSSIIWPLMRKKCQDTWVTTYHRILRTVFHAPRGSPIIHLCHHLHTMDMAERMDSLKGKGTPTLNAV